MVGGRRGVAWDIFLEEGEGKDTRGSGGGDWLSIVGREWREERVPSRRGRLARRERGMSMRPYKVEGGSQVEDLHAVSSKKK